MRYIVSALLLVLSTLCVWSDVKPAPVFGEGMVLQTGIKVPIWGTATTAGEKVTVTFNGRTVSTVAVDGKWRVDLATMKPGGPWPLTIAGANTITFTKVFVGEVWVCSGQSNMWWPVSLCSTAAEAAKEKTETLRLSNGSGPWNAAEGAASQNFSGTGYYFGKWLTEKLHVPVGLIQAAVGGTAAELWTPIETLKSMGYTSGGSLYTQLIAPLQPYAIRGAIWYQGESNVPQAPKYDALMSAMIRSWRAAWNEGDFPFLYVQLPRIGGKPPAPVANLNSSWPPLREQQVMTLAQPNTGMAIYFDATDGNLHPPDKKVIGDRLGLLANSMIYNKKTTDGFSPIVQSAKRVGDKVILSFEHAQNGLIAKDAPNGAINDLFFIDAKGTIAPAVAKVDKKSVVVDMTGQKILPDLYYGWNDYPQGNLFSMAGLPASPFRLRVLRLQLQSSTGSDITLTSNIPLDPKVASKARSYRVKKSTFGAATLPIVEMGKIRKLRLLTDNMGIVITLDKPLVAGQEVTVSFPGLLSWNGKTPAADLSYKAAPVVKD